MSLNLIPLDIQPGLIQDETKFKARQGGYNSVNNVRPHDGGMEVIGGWERFVYTQVLSGKCRGIHSWRDSSGEVNFAFGTHTNLYRWKGGQLYDITPTDFVAGNEDGFGGGGHGVGAWNAGAFGIASEGVYYPLTWTLQNYGEWLVANARGQKIWVHKGDMTSPAVELAPRTTIYDADFSSYADQTAFDVDYTRGAGWAFDATADEADCDGSQTSESDLERSVTGLTIGERYRVTVTYDSLSGGAVSAYGSGSEGVANSEASGTVSVVFIATSTSHNIGARADADFIGSVTDVTVEQMGAPEMAETILVTPSRQICAYGCEEELGIVPNPRCQRWCDIEGVTDWTTKATNNAGEFVHQGTGRLVRAMKVGQVIGVWTDRELIWQIFRGLPGQTWQFNPAGDNCGLVGPNAVAVLGSQAFWCGPDFVFYTAVLGQQAVALPSPIDRTFRDAQVHAQEEKIFCSTISKYNEVWWFYPHEDDETDECSRYYALATREGRSGRWFSGEMERTAMCDSAPFEYPVAVDPDGKIFLHERGKSAAGNPIIWHAETSDIYVSESRRVLQVREIRPDLHDQEGPVKFTMKTKDVPQGDIIVHDTITIEPSEDFVDFRVSGAILSFRWDGDALGGTARLGKPVFDVTQRGRR